ncbi:MAG: TRAP transporter substrate-binding protein DctP [Rhodospirillaceae bacterium]|nr:TRAP transporter substrate-binding protein DctP [Rhodospirillaceae bacterium]
MAVGPAAAQTPPEVIVTGITFPGTITDEQWKVFQANIAARADPPMTLKMLVRGEAGSEEAMVTAARRGRVQLAAPSMSATSQAAPEVAVLALPYLFDSVEQMDFILETVAKDEMRALLGARGLEFLNWIDSGWVGLYARDPLTDPVQVKGYKLRTPPVLAAQIMAQVLAADAVYIPYPEIVPALQTGLIKGGITADYPFFTGGIDSEAPYFIYTRHTYDAGVIFANKAWFDVQSAANQAMLRTAWGDPVDFRARSRDYTAAEMSKLRDKRDGSGTQVIELSPEQRARWVAATRPTHRLLLDRLGPEAVRLYEAIERGKAAYTAQSPPLGAKSQ